MYMNEINPEQLQEWTEFLWSAGWKVLLVFCVLYYKELVIHLGKAIIDFIFRRK